MDQPIPEINWVRIRNAGTTKILPEEWAKIVLYCKFKNLQTILRRRKRS